MAVTFTVDTSGLSDLAGDLAAATPKLAKDVRATMARGALNIKNALRDQATGHPSSVHFPASITYDSEVVTDGVAYEIGPDKTRPQGALGNILYFGTAATPPILRDPGEALHDEVPSLVEHLTAAMVDAFGR